MRIIALNCGTGRPLGCRLLKIMPQRMVCRCLLVEASDELLLVDTGLGLEDVRAPWRRLGLGRTMLGLELLERETAHARIRALGLDPGAVRHIVLTHLDFDHVGGLSDFPEAQVHVFAEEAEAARRRASLGERVRYRIGQLADRARWVTHAGSSGSWFGFDSIPVDLGRSFELQLVQLPGHTRGHCGVALETGRSWLLHAGDSYYSRRELEPGNDTLLLRAFRRGVHVDGRAAAHTLDALRALVCNNEVAMFCSHDPAETVPGAVDCISG